MTINQVLTHVGVVGIWYKIVSAKLRYLPVGQIYQLTDETTKKIYLITVDKNGKYEVA